MWKSEKEKGGRKDHESMENKGMGQRKRLKMDRNGESDVMMTKPSEVQAKAVES